jgi:hypothetical protein
MGVCHGRCGNDISVKDITVILFLLATSLVVFWQFTYDFVKNAPIEAPISF